MRSAVTWIAGSSVADLPVRCHVGPGLAVHLLAEDAWS